MCAAVRIATRSDNDQLNLFKATSDQISRDIIAIHDPQATWQNVDSLFNVVSSIVQNSTNVAKFLDLQGSKTIQLIGSDKVLQSTLMPPLYKLKKIACQMTCEPFNASTAHETIKGILGKLTSYNWDAKAVIALAAFALDYGESFSWGLSLMQATTQNSLDQLHVFRLGGVEKDKPTQHTVDFNSLVQKTLQVIEKIITLEKKIANKNVKLRDVPDLPALTREVYTYWAISALACASQFTQVTEDIRFQAHSKLNTIFDDLGDILRRIEFYEAHMADYHGALHVIKAPSGIVVLLKILVFLKNVDNLEIFDVSTGQSANLDIIAKQHLLLFISGLDSIKKEILEELKSIADDFKKDKDKQDYRILWIPVVKNWTEDLRVKFEKIKPKVPWYVVQNFESLRGIEIIEQKFHYNGRSIVVVTNPRGDIINQNAMHMILAGGITALRVLLAGAGEQIERWNWFWWAASKVNSQIDDWVKNEKYIFFYGGVNDEVTQRLAELIDSVKGAIESVASIEHFNLGRAENKASKFWESIYNSFCSNFFANKDIGKILSKRKENGWVLVGKGKRVLVIDSYPPIEDVLKDVKEDQEKYAKNGAFEKAFVDLHEKRRRESSGCSHFKVVDIRSRVPTAVICPDCNTKMQIKSVSYGCCHGSDDSETFTEVDAMPNVQVQDTNNAINAGQGT